MSHCHMRVTATRSQDGSSSISSHQILTMVVEATDWLVTVSPISSDPGDDRRRCVAGLGALRGLEAGKD